MNAMSDQEIWAATGGASFEEFRKCNHVGTSEVRYRFDKLGRKRFASQCTACGYYGFIGGKSGLHPFSIEQAEALSGLPAHKIPGFDEEWFESVVAKFKADRNQSYHRLKAEQRKANREERAPYYSTPEWEEKRQLVFARAKGVCEGCGKAHATQCHHISYEHFGEEFLFELQALCEPCHVRWHAKTRSFDDAMLEVGEP